MALPNEVIAKLKSAIQQYDNNIDNLKHEISRARAAGIDVTPLQSQLTTLENQVRQIKTQYASELAS